MPFSSVLDSKKEYSTRELLVDIWALMKGRRILFFLGSFMRLIANVLWLYPAYVFSRIIPELAQFKSGQSLDTVWFFMGSWAVIMVVASLLNYISNYIVFRIGQRVLLDAQLQSFNHLLYLDIAWHEHENAGNKIKRIDRGSNAINELIRMWHGQIMGIISGFVGIIIIISVLDITVTAMILVFMVMYYYVSAQLVKKTRAAQREVNVAEEEMSGLSFETMNNIRTVKVLALVASLKKMLTKKASQLYERLGRRVYWFQLRGSILDNIITAFRLFTFSYIIFGISRGVHDVGFLILFHMYFNQITDAINRFADMTQDYIIGKQNIARMKEITTTPITIDNDAGKRAFPKQWESLTLSNVSFRYNNNAVLKDINLEIKRGEKIGIVGLSGAGKSTLFKLLLKEYEDYSGEILVNKTPLKTIRRSAYLQHIAVVMQETEVFNFSLKENIVIANPSAQNDTVFLSRAMKTAHVSDFVSKLPEGIDTLIGEKGVKLSGGEKQRLGIARAIFKKPDILFMDEATSHLDLESEEKIRDSLHTFFKGITAVVIAHRLTTIKQMDRIIVLEHGCIIEQGTFDQLMAQHGRFFTLWQKQQL